MSKASTLMICAAALSCANSANAAVFGIQSIIDPNVPEGYVANELIWDGGETEDWSGNALRIDLSAGSFYHHLYGGNGTVPQAVIDLFPEVEFDTHVGIQGDSTVYIPGGAGDLGAGPLSMTAPQLSVTWGNINHDNTGYLRIGMITMSNDAVGTGSLLAPGGTMISFSINGGVATDTYANVSGGAAEPPDSREPGRFPDLPGPPVPSEIGITTRVVVSPDVPNGYVANEVIWNGRNHDAWNSSTVRVDLTSGDVYNHPFGFDTPPTSALIGNYPELEFDTYLGIIDDSNGAVVNSYELNGGSLSLEAPHVSAGWFTSGNEFEGIVRIGMLTFSEDANGVIAFDYPGASWSATIVNGVVIPEPTIPTLLALASPALLIKRRN